jgi:antitoxin component of MazEF toxin-antitoxin module
MRRHYQLADLLAGVTKANRHGEVDFGAPAGLEV